MWDIIIGLVFIVGGLSGHLSLRFTNSGYALAGVGALLVAWGSYRIYRDRNRKKARQLGSGPTQDPPQPPEDKSQSGR